MFTPTSILNGIVGDFLDASDNELATPMQWYPTCNPKDPRFGMPCDVHQLQQELVQKSSSGQHHVILLFLHGLLGIETAWNFDPTTAPKSGKDESDEEEDDNNTNYGSLLQQDLTKSTTNVMVTPLYLRYNTGLGIATNGQKLCHLLESLCLPLAKTTTATSMVMIGHSMGGLVAKSAVLQALASKQIAESPSWWVQQVRTILFLGTPHGGSYWEKAGNVVALTMDAIPRPYMKLAAKIGNLRSRGIKDLRYGTVLASSSKDDDDAMVKKTGGDEEDDDDDDWGDDWGDHWMALATEDDSGNDAEAQDEEEEELEDQDMMVLKPPNDASEPKFIACYVASGTVTTNPHNPISLVFGDGLVSRASAEGKSAFAGGEAGEYLRLQSHREFPGIAHNALPANMQVYQQIKDWVEQSLQTRSMETEVTCSDTFMLEENDDTMNMVKAADRSITESNDDAGGRQQETPPSRWAPFRGAASLVQVAVDAGSTAVQNVQLEMTNEIYDIVGMIKPITPSVRKVQLIHTQIVGATYSMIRGVNYFTGESCKLVLDGLESKDFSTRQGES